ncbi:transcriptional regulator [Sphaerisporangium melleum]|uniref:Transcriptional regulator n=1 Tax=Sphaerisporangium melleum TaxID=321316 RepID=A0A917RA66_9ACTN|nr:helix-turn-helix transcriptional regulator [Sphaerisporangium melleum]GGK97205.1 transcriptional regulator [Sphaerisporangium melleum]GII71085.1 transcriptional regulator [Sphaerisporangium melleum]
MPSDCEIDPYESPRALFAFELRRHRQAAGLSMRQLGERIGYSDSLVNLVELCKRAPSRQFAELCDRALGLDGTMARLHAATTWRRAPEYLRPWLEEEEDATSLRTWQPTLVPGLLQTEEYAREILATWPGISTERVEERLVGRMERQAIFQRETPPDFTVIIDEDVITHVIGSPKIMRDQLAHLLEMAQHPQVTIQIVPYAARPHCGQAGGFVIAERHGHPYAAFADAQPLGRTFDERKLMAELIRRYDAIRADAVPFKESLRLIEEAVSRIGA